MSRRRNWGYVSPGEVWGAKVGHGWLREGAEDKSGGLRGVGEGDIGAVWACGGLEGKAIGKVWGGGRNG